MQPFFLQIFTNISISTIPPCSAYLACKYATEADIKVHYIPFILPQTFHIPYSSTVICNHWKASQHPDNFLIEFLENNYRVSKMTSIFSYLLTLSSFDFIDQDVPDYKPQQILFRLHYEKLWLFPSKCASQVSLFPSIKFNLAQLCVIFKSCFQIACRSSCACYFFN